MPRLTSNQYYRAHLQLRRIWLTRHGIFAEVTPAEQWQLHDYFKPSHELTKSDLLTHRTHITLKCPHLPQQAGKAYTKLIRAAAAWAARLTATNHQVVRISGRGVQQHIRVGGVVRPEIDAHALARALIEMAKADVAARLAAKRQESEQSTVGE